MNLTMTVDPESPDEIRALIGLLEHLLPQEKGKPDLGPIIEAVASDKYGESRLGYLLEVAEAGDAGAPIDALMTVYFGGSFQKYGGTHASIEKTWRTRGGQAWADKLIDDTPDGQRQVMIPEARQLVVKSVYSETVAELQAAYDRLTDDINDA